MMAVNGMLAIRDVNCMLGAVAKAVSAPKQLHHYFILVHETITSYLLPGLHYYLKK